MGRFAKIAAVGALALGSVALAPMSAQASAGTGSAVEAQASTTATACGFLGTSYWIAGQTSAYNHCGSGKVLVRLDYNVGSDTRCLNPGVTDGITSPLWNPIINIYAIGSC
ncbi:hypothetical protein StoSoilB3_26140 [Arthrobacter sp. StoSoilB3]|jgi:hypothetical protein|uniref:DUF6355 family natural product biosynthesis protein n=2 Tax=Micrococcaceae TaxID=1268 RepID=UPI0009CA7E30|nr:hypothetical protein [Paenarthrobacter nicotinovorans]SKB31289.1 hypothetical protein SAMN05660916_00107 [Arthrobacter sp. 31Cvi3.1E]BCW11238.1 hypothetical protein NtRootA2_25200 [Arthrobacter sp. NtRootA2]BCW15320.1 hypothetical protein NtRootA4_22990 [Arthrobacter sp. NtRootA4]BCW23655.1 hypothetical protein NtRootC7_25220 [Arthrobacter sp. NtRootC7]BCW27923.1 hypothetical protein NtRootC45_25230 [Arthrobacter sp. NtRootC45]BCW32193.1 hypothetical protein NtRootD5_25240 [Arthrobacter sp